MTLFNPFFDIGGNHFDNFTSISAYWETKLGTFGQFGLDLGQ